MREKVAKVLNRIRTLTLTEILLLLIAFLLFVNWQKQQDVYDSVEGARARIFGISDDVDSIQTDVDSIQSDVSDIRANQP